MKSYIQIKSVYNLQKSATKDTERKINAVSIKTAQAIKKFLAWDEQRKSRKDFIYLIESSGIILTQMERKEN